MKKLLKYKKLLLSVVALVLIMLFTVGTTYSWIENIYLVEFNTKDDSEHEHPLTISDNIDAEWNVAESTATVQLGRLANDTTHVIQKKGYFYESGDMHLSPCYGNGESFYFPVGAHDGTAASYRLGNHDDENVNYISMTLKVTSPTAKTEYWFENFNVTLKDKNGDAVENADDYIRFSVTSDGSTSVYSNNGTYKSLTSTSGTPSAKGCGEINDYKYAASNRHSYRKTYGNTLFAVPKGETKIVNFKIWLEKPTNDTIDSVTVSDIDITLSSSWAKTRRITVEDKTTGAGAESWLTDNHARIYLCIPSLDPTGWNDASVKYSDGRIELTQTDASGNRYVDIPAVYNTEKMYLIRTNSNGFKNGKDQATYNNKNDGSETYQLGDKDTYLNSLTKKIYGWNYWETNMPDTFCDETYTLYGGSYDKTAADTYSNSGIAGTSTKFGDATYLGYGTWSGVVEIKICGDSGVSNNYMYYNTGDIQKTHLFVEDYSDYVSAKKVYVYTMNCYDTSSSPNSWRVYVPKTSTKIEFSYKYPDEWKERYWGFSSQNSATEYKTNFSFVNGYSRPSGTDYTTFKIYDTFSDNTNKNGKGTGIWTTDSGAATTASTSASSSGSMDGYKSSNSNYYLKNSSNNKFYFHQKSDNSNSYKAEVEYSGTKSMTFNVFNDSNPTNPTNCTKYGLTKYQSYSAGSNMYIKLYVVQQGSDFGVNVSSTGKYIFTMVLDEQRTDYYNVVKITSIEKSN